VRAVIDARPQSLLGHRGVLRAAVNVGNPVLATRQADGRLTGATVDLAREIARRLGLQASLVAYEGAGQVVVDATADNWDVAFLAIDTQRGKEVAYTASYVEIEGVFVVPVESPFQQPEALDAIGVRIGVGKGAAYDLHLSRSFSRATFIRYPTSAAVFSAISYDRLDAIAGIRQPAEAFAKIASGFRVIQTPFMKIHQALAVAKKNAAAIVWLQTQIDELLSNGFIVNALAMAGQDVNIAVIRRPGATP
jgi:polar amino acid transport system substrate-binding protein